MIFSFSIRTRGLSFVLMILTLAGFADCYPVMAATTSTTMSASQAQGTYERGTVDKVVQASRRLSTGAEQVNAYTIRFLSGPIKGQTRDIVDEVGSNPYGIQPRVGDALVILIQPDASGASAYYIQGYDRHAAMLWLGALFVLTLILLAGWQGVKVAASIMLSLLLFGYVLIPAFLHGANPVPIAILIAGALAFLSAGLSTGWNRKSLVTAVGTIGGVLVAYLISQWFAGWSHLTGLSSEEDRLFFGDNPKLNPQGLLFAGIIIASLGVVEDVAVSIASGVSEVKRANPQARFRELYASGMVVGKDHMAALANTLVYAYVGGSLSTLLLYTQFGASWFKFINFDSVVDEIIRSLSGTIGLIFTVPITALLSAWVMEHTQPEALNALPEDPHEQLHAHGSMLHPQPQTRIHRTPKG